MSRLFEALQRSESERTGAPFAWPHLAPEPTLRPMEIGTLAECESVAVEPQAESKLVGLMDKDGLGAEKFRFLAVRLRQISQTRPIKKVLITSTMPEEGKSLVSANLAIAFAHRHVQKILLVDGDLRRPALAKQFGLETAKGLCECLEAGKSVTDNVYYLKDAGFWFMPAGNAPENPLELLQSDRLSQVFEQLTALFDWIVIDSPPVLPLGDASVWMRMVDGSLLVVREGKSQAGELKAGVQLLTSKNLIGVVLNSCSTVDRSKYYQRYYFPSSVAPPRTLLP
jgi:capsular exopolysaccharide synthesis family protein